MIKILSLAVMIAAMIAILLTGWILLSAPFHWLSLGFMAYCRPRLVLLRTAIVFFAIWTLVVLLLPLGEGSVIGMLLAIVLTPWLAKAWASTAAFRRDTPEMREAAAATRNETVERQGDGQRVKASKRWRNYIIDAERARRTAAYELPSIASP